MLHCMTHTHSTVLTEVIYVRRSYVSDILHASFINHIDNSYSVLLISARKLKHSILSLP